MAEASSVKSQLDEEKEWSFLGTAGWHASHFRNIYQRVCSEGHYVSPRGQKVIEVENFSFELPPYVRFTNFYARKFNLAYVKKELLWYLRGDRFDTSIADEAKMWGPLIHTDGSLDSNYGQYIFGEGQFDRVIEILRGDPDSRRAVIVILNSKHIAGDRADIPCTYSIAFRIRERESPDGGALNMTVRMRSNDAIFGMSNDVPLFSLIHEMMLHALREIYPRLEYGTYHHSADSFHVYERHFGMLDELTSRDHMYILIKCPMISGPDEVRYLRAGVANLEHIPEKFKYSRWLKEA